MLIEEQKLATKNSKTMATKNIATKKRTTAKKATKKSASRKKWSHNVTEHSNALDLQQGVFKNRDPKKIAQSLKRSAEHSKRKKSGPYQSAMSMLNFYINRAGKSLTKKEKQPLEKAKGELRKLFHRDEE
jgi:predicted HNH restriction endonuclease